MMTRIARSGQETDSDGPDAGDAIGHPGAEVVAELCRSTGIGVAVVHAQRVPAVVGHVRAGHCEEEGPGLLDVTSDAAHLSDERCLRQAPERR